ncbi:MAG: MBL fold metallo-hydrolase [Elusimicrobiales bacterium]|nr:MBL fold metallo-hydrolase [Elusimicrobiales bacterium]
MRFPNSIRIFPKHIPNDKNYLRNGFFANTAIVFGSKKIALIDTPMLQSLTNSIFKRLNGRVPDYIINTHGHLDHHLTNCCFNSKTIIQSQEMAACLKKQDDYIGYYCGLKEYKPVACELRKLSVMPAGIKVKRTLKVSLGDIHLDIQFIGAGETADNLVIFIPEHKILFAGDLIYHKVHPFIGDINKIPEWIAALKSLEKFKADIIVPGHGKPGCANAIAEQIQYLEYFSQQFSKLCDAGQSAETIKKKLALGKFSGYKMRKTFLEFSIDCLIAGYPQSNATS